MVTEFGMSDLGPINYDGAPEFGWLAREMSSGPGHSEEMAAKIDNEVKKIMDFGAFVELFPGTEGLVHISQIVDRRIRSVTEILKEGDETPVKVLEIDHQGKIRLSRKEAIEEGHTMSGN